MPLDTLAFTKHLENEGVDRRVAEAHAAAITQHLLPDLATKADVDNLRMGMDAKFESLKADMTLRIVGLLAAFNALLFALLRFTTP